MYEDLNIYKKKTQQTIVSSVIEANSFTEPGNRSVGVALEMFPCAEMNFRSFPFHRKELYNL